MRSVVVRPAGDFSTETLFARSMVILNKSLVARIGAHCFKVRRADFLNLFDSVFVHFLDTHHADAEHKRFFTVLIVLILAGFSDDSSDIDSAAVRLSVIDISCALLLIPHQKLSLASLAAASALGIWSCPLLIIHQTACCGVVSGSSDGNGL